MSLAAALNPLRWFSRRPAGPPPVSNGRNRRMLRARFDSQFTTPDNQNHWALADAMSIDASANWMVRRQLRMRARYEYHNNSWLMGMAQTLANYVVGTGPRLQMTTPNKAMNAAIEDAWKEWGKQVRLPRTLRSLRAARVYNGESFALLRTNPGLHHPVKMDLFEIECDQVTSPLFGMYPAQYPDQFFDGVVLDTFGRPQEYHILRQHPGAFGAFVIMGYEFDRWPARYVLHDFKQIRPGQQRGVPEVAPALDKFGHLRRYGKAVLGAAETAADFNAVVKSEAPAEAGGDEVSPMDTIELRDGMATVLPPGYDLGQVKAEQPVTTYDTYTNAVLSEIGRCLDVPLFFLTLDARLANMASAYVVSQTFSRAVQVDRSGYEDLLDRVLDEFLTEAVRVPGYLPKDLPASFDHVWRWSRLGQHGDPNKVANAQKTRIQSGVSSIPLEAAEDGYDWEEVQASNAKSLGMSLDEYRAMLRQFLFAASGNPAPAALDEEPDPVPDGTPDPVRQGGYEPDAFEP
jgi:lambda family phage portal protein